MGKLIVTFKQFIDRLLTGPYTLMAISLLAIFSVMAIPELVDYVFGGALFTLVKCFVAVAALLAGVKLVSRARAYFNNAKPEGFTDGSEAILVAAVYVSVAIVVAAAFVG